MLNSDHCLAAYRIVQEALNNAFKHAHAHNIDIRTTLQHSDSIHQAPRFTLSISDDGVGRSTQIPEPGRWGVKGMQERVQGLGGEWTLVDRQPHGLTILAKWEI